MDNELNELRRRCITSDMSKEAKEMFCYASSNFGREEFTRDKVELFWKWRTRMTVKELIREYYFICIHGNFQINPRLLDEIARGM